MKASSFAEIAAPPSKLPGGKTNPAYTRWYRSTEKGAEISRKARRKYEQKPTSKKAKAERQSRKFREQFPNGMRYCVDCKCQFRSEDVITRGWPHIGFFGTRCDICGSEGLE